MRGRRFWRAASFIGACVTAGVALAALAVLLFPQLGGGAVERLLARRAASVPMQPAPPPVVDAQRTAATGGSVPGSPAADNLAMAGPGATAPPAPSLADVVGPQPPTYSYAAAVRASAPAVVNVYTARVVTERLPTPNVEQFFGGPVLPRFRQRVQNALGSGVIVDRSGHIITNNHVIEGASQIRVQLADGRSGAAQVVGRDPDTDLAVLKIDLKNVPVMRLGRSDTLQVGDLVLAIGNPLGLTQTVTHGIVSAKERAQLGVATYESFIQTDAAINEGNSGGALVNGRGELVGINTAVLGKQIGAEGIGVSIPVELVRGVMQEILAHGRVIRGWIGISPLDVNERMALQFNLPVGAVVIASVAQDSPAARAGLSSGDIVLAVGDREVRSAQDAMTQIAMRRPGASVAITGLRDGQRFTVRLAVADPPPVSR